MDHRKAYLAEISLALKPKPGQPHVVYDQPMPPYRFQAPDFGGGWVGSDGSGGMRRDGGSVG